MRVLVCGAGNVLKGDDGFGVRTAQALADSGDMPRGVSVIETGIGGIHLVQELQQGYDALILLDAMDRGGSPGTLYMVEPILPAFAAVSDQDKRDFFADVHYATPLRAMSLARELGVLPPIVRIIGCQPQDAYSYGTDLSAPVAASIDGAVALVRKAVSDLMEQF